MNRTEDIMTTDLITVTPETTMANAYRLMHLNNIRHLPVVDERGKIVGILSDRDIQRSMNVEKINSFQQSVSIGGDRKVEDFMSWPVYTVAEATGIGKVVEEMLAQKVSAFIVTDSVGHHKGIITTDDLLSYLLKLVRENSAKYFSPIAHYFLSDRNAQ